MQYKAILAAFVASAAAQSADVEGFESAYLSYYSNLVGDPSFLSQVAGLATDTALLESLQGLATAQPNPSALATGPPAAITGLPSPYNSLFESIYTVELSLASQYGLLDGTGLASGVSSSLGAAVTGAQSSAAAGLSSIAAQASDAASSAGSAANSAATSPTNSVSKAGAAPTGVAVMGLAAAAIGGIAAIL